MCNACDVVWCAAWCCVVLRGVLRDVVVLRGVLR